MGDQCPIPVIKTKALKEITETTLVEVHVDNEIAVQNLSKMAKQKI
ncbi:MAG: sulfurtransferase TusA family protein [Intestinibacter sp.]